MIQHFVSISGGKDSAATACLAIERAEKRDMNMRFMFADTGNEHDVTLEHIAYMERTLGITVETVRADFTHRFQARREAIARDWSKELRRKMHSPECLARQRDDLAYAERAALRGRCDCPIKVSPPVPDDLIARAIEMMVPSGNPFLDMAMLHGRFPGTKTRFCTSELNLEPMDRVKDPIRMAGTPIVEWIGERADESRARANKPMLEIRRCTFRAPAVMYRPLIHQTALDAFAIAKRHGLKPNPLYLMNMGRVGCFCINITKNELRETALRFPKVIARIREWEGIVDNVSRRAASGGSCATFIPAVNIPGGLDDPRTGRIDGQIAWSNTTKGGRNFDLLHHLDAMDGPDQQRSCSSQYALCE